METLEDLTKNSESWLVNQITDGHCLSACVEMLGRLQGKVLDHVKIHAILTENGSAVPNLGSLIKLRRIGIYARAYKFDKTVNLPPKSSIIHHTRGHFSVYIDSKDGNSFTNDPEVGFMSLPTEIFLSSLSSVYCALIFDEIDDIMLKKPKNTVYISIIFALYLGLYLMSRLVNLYSDFLIQSLLFSLVLCLIFYTIARIRKIGAIYRNVFAILSSNILGILAVLVFSIANIFLTLTLDIEQYLSIMFCIIQAILWKHILIEKWKHYRPVLFSLIAAFVISESLLEISIYTSLILVQLFIADLVIYKLPVLSDVNETAAKQLRSLIISKVVEMREGRNE